MIDNSYKNNVKLFFDKANEIKVVFKAKSTIIRDKEGSLVMDRTKVVNKFKNIFEKLLNQPSQLDVKKKFSTVEQNL